MWQKEYWFRPPIINYSTYEDEALLDVSLRKALKEEKRKRSLEQLHQDIDLIIFPLSNQSDNSYRPMTIIGIKIVGIAASYLASYPFIKPAEEVTDNDALKKCFAAGEFLAWGTLTAWSACKLIDRISKTNNNQKGTCRSAAAYWVPLYCLGIASEIPSAYVSYQYNQSVFWMIYTPLLNSLFGTQSMDLLIQKMAHSNNFLTRCLYRNTAKPNIFKAKDKFVNILQKFLSDVISKQDPSFKDKVLKIGFSQQIEKNDRCAFAVLHMLKVGLEIKMKTIESQSVHVKFGNRVVQVVGSAGSLAMSGVDGYLVYKGCDLFIESRILIGLIVFISIAPSAYLSLDINRKNYSNVFLSIINLKNSSTAQLPNRFGNALSLLITCFGLGSLFTILRDTISFDNFWAILSISVLVASGVLAANALNEFFDFVIDEVRFLRMDADQKKLAEFNRRLQNLIDHFKTVPATAFQDFLTALKTEDLGVSEFNNFFEKLQSSPDGQNLIQNIENKLKSFESNSSQENLGLVET